jgi:hypothetical protein
LKEVYQRLLVTLRGWSDCMVNNENEFRPRRVADTAMHCANKLMPVQTDETDRIRNQHVRNNVTTAIIMLLPCLSPSTLYPLVKVFRLFWSKGWHPIDSASRDERAAHHSASPPLQPTTTDRRATILPFPDQGVTQPFTTTRCRRNKLAPLPREWLV